MYRDGDFMEEAAENIYKEVLSSFDEKYCYTVIAVCPANLESEPSNEVCTTIVSIDELENGIKIYPNPTGDELKITYYRNDVQTIEIFDVMGRKQPSTFNFQLSTLDISRLPAGIYFLQIKTENETFMRKVVKR